MKKTCTFFGHRQCPDSVYPKLQAVITELIEQQGVEMFYVGNNGKFDKLVRSALRDLQTAYPNIGYAVVLAYMPPVRAGEYGLDYSDTLLPTGIEAVPKRFAISWRNNWMLKRADYVVAYVCYSGGGAAQFVEKAERQKKTVINLARL